MQLQGMQLAVCIEGQIPSKKKLKIMQLQLSIAHNSYLLRTSGQPVFSVFNSDIYIIYSYSLYTCSHSLTAKGIYMMTTFENV